MGSWVAVRRVVRVRAEVEGEQWERECEGDCEGVHQVGPDFYFYFCYFYLCSQGLHYTVHRGEKEFRVLSKE